MSSLSSPLRINQPGMIGQTVSHYRILEKLGEGGMGVVYRAEDVRLGRQVALKALSPELAHDPQHRKRFQQEARAAAILAHPGIATVYELEEAGEDLYIVYEYVRGENLRTVIDREKPELGQLLEMVVDITEALASAHESGIVHRDLKPENVMLTREGRCKILDFGLARFEFKGLDHPTVSRLTEPGLVVGTIAYMSPEQLEGEEPDFRSDIFSFGSLLYELASGIHPFEASTPASTIARILTSEPVPLLQRNPLTPPELDRIARKCLRRRPGERYQSTRDLAVDLENLRREHVTGLRTTVLDLPASESSVLRGAFSNSTLSPLRWWEINHLFCLSFIPIFVYLSWKAKEWIPGLLGLGLFFAVTVLAAILFNLRAYLLLTALFHPRGLAAEVRRIEPWQRRVDIVFMLVLVATAAAIAVSHPAVAGLLAALAAGGIIIHVLVEPAIARSAFPAEH